MKYLLFIYSSINYQITGQWHIAAKQICLISTNYSDLESNELHMQICMQIR